MQTEHRQTRPDRAGAPLGFSRAPVEDDPRSDLKLLEAVARIAPGTELRMAIDDIIRSHEGALIVIGEPSKLEFLFSGGIRLDQPFTPQLLYELSKMDGAIIVNASATKLVHANVQLMPDPTIESQETGTRHRTAERVAKQTKALVISISQQRETVTVFQGDHRYQLDAIADVLAKTNQAVATLDTYRTRLEQVLTRLTALEFQNAVMLDDVLVVLQRAEMTMRMAAEIERDCVELGTEGRLIRMQLEELVAEVPAERAAVVLDYQVGETSTARETLDGLAALPHHHLLELDRLSVLLGYPRSVNPLDHSVAPRGFRVLSHIPRLPDGVIKRVVRELDGLESIVRATQRELEAVEGVGSVRAREIREGLRRLQEHNLVERYLQV
jgi:diadenylate cyclase